MQIFDFVWYAVVLEVSSIAQRYDCNLGVVALHLWMPFGCVVPRDGTVRQDGWSILVSHRVVVLHLGSGVSLAKSVQRVRFLFACRDLL